MFCKPTLQDLSLEGRERALRYLAFSWSQAKRAFGLGIVLPEPLGPQGTHTQQPAQRMSYLSGLTLDWLLNL